VLELKDTKWGKKFSCWPDSIDQHVTANESNVVVSKKQPDTQ